LAKRDVRGMGMGMSMGMGVGLAVDDGLGVGVGCEFTAECARFTAEPKPVAKPVGVDSLEAERLGAPAYREDA
jgi:hypothetical protein